MGLVNTLLPRTGIPDAVLNGAITNTQLTLTLLAVPANLPATGTLRARIGIEGTSDAHDEFITLILPPSGSTFTIARETEEATAFPKCAHSSGAPVYLDLTKAGLEEAITAEALSVGASAAAQHKVLGYNTIGASLESVTNDRIYYKKVTLANAGLLSNVSTNIKQVDTNSTVQMNVAVMQDNAGAPGTIIGINNGGNDPDGFLIDAAGTQGWLQMPMGLWLEAGDYWLAVQFTRSTAGFSIAYDTGGSDPVATAGAFYIAPPAIHATSNSTKKYSIRADFFEVLVVGAGLDVQELVLGADYTVPNGSFGNVTGMGITLDAGDYLVTGQIYQQNPSNNGSLTLDLSDGTTVYAHTTGSQSATFFGTTIPFNKKITLAATATLQFRAQANAGSWKLMKGDQLALGGQYILGTVLTFIKISSGGGGSGGGDVVKIAEISPTGTNVDFTSIPATYRNLKIVWQALGTDAGGQLVTLQFNGDTGAHYTDAHLFTRFRDGGAIGGTAVGSLSGFTVGATQPSGTGLPNGGEILIPNYAGSLKKMAHSDCAHSDSTDLYRFLGDGWWNDTAVINEIKLTVAAGNFAAGSVFTLYGIK